MVRKNWLAASALSTILIAMPALAADTSDSEGAAAKDKADYHALPSPEIVVSAPLSQDKRDILSSVSVLQGAELTQELRPTIGETLNSTPGVSSTSFGPNASRPVLRGLQGERVRILTDGIGSIDVSNTSVDHAVVVDPLLAERVEVLRGPAALQYGSSALGGVVNVIDKRIPLKVPDEPVHIDAIGTYGSAANERSGAASIDVPVTSQIVVHADGSYLKTDDLHIGGYALTPALRQQALATAASGLGDPDIDYAGNAAVHGTLPNSGSKTWQAAIGAAVINEGGNLGFSYSHYDSTYGVPIRFATTPGQEQEAPRLALKQDRIDFRGEIETGGDILKQIKTRIGYAHYRHFELEADGSVGTAFYNDGLEGRLEFVQADHGPWKGVTGVQYFSRDFNVIGDEAFLPKSATQQLGVFSLQQIELGKVKVEAGGRYEHTQLTSSPTADQSQFFSGKRQFDTFSGSLGASYAFKPDWRIGLNLSRTVRAPSAEELFANGPHGGTEAFEVGNPNFRTEKSWGVEAVLRGKGKGYQFEASAYHDWFSNFIYEVQTGALEDGLPVYQSYQADARYYGFEVQGSVDLFRLGAVQVGADALADYVHATITGSGPAPRIPPLRTLTGVTAKSPYVDGRVEVEWSDKQDRIAPIETPTASFTLVNASTTIRPWGEHGHISFVLSANNIFDVDARRHASFLKDYAPLSGRDFRITARANF